MSLSTGPILILRASITQPTGSPGWLSSSAFLVQVSPGILFGVSAKVQIGSQLYVGFPFDFDW